MSEPEESQSSSSSRLTYEETPIIDPHSGEVSDQDDASRVIPEAAKVFQTAQAGGAPESSAHRESVPVALPKRPKRHLGTVIFVFLLFVLGVWLSMELRSFIEPTVTEEVPVPTSVISGNPTPEQRRVASASADKFDTWVTQEIISGVTKKPVPGLSYRLPGDVKAPTCDSASCASSGTNLPGGTRFTVAARGRGQLLPDFRGAILTDASGKEFVMKQSTVGGVYVYEYTGAFTGRTGGGYTFTNMRGVLVPVSETLAIEFNHFSPVGPVTDFNKDDALFDQIIATFTGGSGITPTRLPTVSLPTSTPATSAAF